MRFLPTLSALLPLALCAQTTWWVEVGGSVAIGSDTLPYFEPDTFSIALNDIVHFHCVSGTHNIWGEADMFPDNPEFFHSHVDPEDAVWDYTRTFDVAGVYEYMCTQNNHSDTQMGMLTVGPTGIEENTTGSFVLYPVPSRELLTIALESGTVSWQLVSMDGKILREGTPNGTTAITMSTHSLAPGKYLVRSFSADGQPQVRSFLKQ